MSVYTEARALQDAVLAQDEAALRLMARALADALPALTAEAARDAARIAAMREAGATPTELQLFSAQRSRAVANQVEAEISRIMQALRPALEVGQIDAMQAGLDTARRLVETQLPAGARLGAWQTPNLAAVQSAVGAQQGAPLGTLLDALGPDAGKRLRVALNAGLLAGKNPRVIARRLREEAALSAVRAQTISRTETLRSFRVASLTAYERNGIRRYRRLAAKSVRTCAACLAADQTEQDTSEMIATHPVCRCTVVPIVDLPGVRQPARESGADWFAKQPPETQRAILGPGGAKLYEAGTPLSAWVKIQHDPVWGPTVSQRPLREIAA